MKNRFSETEIRSITKIVADLTQGRTAQGVKKLRKLKDDIYEAIPAKKRQSRGITWVLQRISNVLVEMCDTENQIKKITLIMYKHIAKNDKLVGIPIFMMAEYGKNHPAEVFGFFAEVADSEDWEVREFAAGGFHKLIKLNKDAVLPWLKKIAQSDKFNLRRFVSETLRPVTDNRWMNSEPEYSLSVLRLLFRESHPYPRTSVGNNLSDLSKSNPGLIFSVVKELVETKDKNSYWIAYRACRNLVKQNPEKAMDILGVDEYHYKDRNIYREK